MTPFKTIEQMKSYTERCVAFLRNGITRQELNGQCRFCRRLYSARMEDYLMGVESNLCERCWWKSKGMTYEPKYESKND